MKIKKIRKDKQNDYRNKKTYVFSDSEILDILCACFEGGCNYWATIINDTDEWDRVAANIRSNDPEYTIEDVMLTLLQHSEGFDICDDEDDVTYRLTLSKLEHGISKAIENQDWDGDIDDLDGESGDAIIQYAIFNEIIFG